MNENRILVSVKKIDKIEPLTLKSTGETARSVLAFIGGWKATVGANEFNVGDLVVFAEPDSIFPVEERWSFLERHKYRIKTQKYGNLIRPNGEAVVSQGLILSISVLPEGNTYKEGDDVTKVLGVTHAPEQDEDEFADNAEFGKDKAKVVRFKKWMPAKMFNTLMRYDWFRKMAIPPKEFKGFVREVSKTDEERIQNCGDIVNADTVWTLTEKVDGMSSTYRLKKRPRNLSNRLFGTYKYDFAVCSRNNRLNNPDNSAYWAMAEKYKIADALKKIIGNNDWVAIQGEVSGPRCNGNRQGLQTNRLFVFNLYYPTGRVKSVEAAEIIKNIGLEWVPIIATGVDLHGKTEEDLLNMANGKSALNPDKMREGIVFRAENQDMDLSFKAVSPEYLLKIGE